MKNDSTIWGPHFWFFLHSLAFNYPETPNEVMKRKYYDILNNFPLFIPDEQMGKQFADILDKYPFKPYLDKRDSLIRWVWFIHNKINIMIKKHETPLLYSIDKYLEYIKKSEKKDKEVEKIFYLDFIIYFILICILLLIIYYMINK